MIGSAVRNLMVAASAKLASAAAEQDSAEVSLATLETNRIKPAPSVNLFVREAGDGEPLILLHGWPQHGLMEPRAPSFPRPAISSETRIPTL